ncbi:hypothetical protein [Francisella tularensis]|uniref:hypothetical protein n=1 Tax=Francisella tularensis TaxID=263 RepID=UPI001C0F27D8|nr:hypothetical protein [Francisella tularensis]MBK2108945.1 hypothetical protein [Francisella tularensis subsp. novicida FSC595]
MIEKMRGSSLVAALIFAFVLMIVISALAYNFKMDSLAINTLVDEKQNLNVDEGYFGNIIGTVDLTTTTDQTSGDFRFVTTPSSIAPRFQYENTNAELYNADAYLISYDIKHEFYDNSVLKYVRDFIYNTLPNSLMTKSGDNIFPLNVPFVNPDAMTGNLANYKLSIDGKILDQERGYVGYIQKNNNTLMVSNAGGSFNLTIPNDLSVASYTVSVGWDLKAGYWSLFLAIYDGNKVYTSSTTLDNLIGAQVQAQLDLSNWQAVADLPGGYASNFPTYSPGTTYQVGDIVNSEGNLYSCKVVSWCSSDAQANVDAYAPGTGSAWSLAWDLVESGSAPNDGGGSGSHPTYSAGTSYQNDDIVVSGENLYSCKVAGWCSSSAGSAYAPGTGSAWQEAWDLVGPVDSGGDDSSDNQSGSGSDPEGNIILVTWYHDFNNQVPKPLVLRKMPRNGNYDLDVYMTTYNSATKIFTASLADSFTTGATDFDDSQVHIVIPDSLFVLDAGVPLIFQGTNIFDFNALGSYLLGSGTGGSTRGVLAAAATDKPVLIKRNATQLLIVYFNGSTYYKYLYSLGVAAPTSLPSRDFPGETIQKIIAKFGALFIITNSNIYVEDIANNNLISSVAIAGSNYQILRDGNGRIYAIADGLSCTISSNCTNAARVYFDTGCAAYNACSSLESLENVQPYLNMVYKSFQ